MRQLIFEQADVVFIEELGCLTQEEHHVAVGEELARPLRARDDRIVHARRVDDGDAREIRVALIERHALDEGRAAAVCARVLVERGGELFVGAERMLDRALREDVVHRDAALTRGLDKLPRHACVFCGRVRVRGALHLRPFFGRVELDGERVLLGVFDLRETRRLRRECLWQHMMAVEDDRVQKGGFARFDAADDGDVELALRGGEVVPLAAQLVLQCLHGECRIVRVRLKSADDGREFCVEQRFDAPFLRFDGVELDDGHCEPPCSVDFY